MAAEVEKGSGGADWATPPVEDDLNQVKFQSAAQVMTKSKSGTMTMGEAEKPQSAMKGTVSQQDVFMESDDDHQAAADAERCESAPQPDQDAGRLSSNNSEALAARPVSHADDNGDLCKLLRHPYNEQRRPSRKGPMDDVLFESGFDSDLSMANELGAEEGLVDLLMFTQCHGKVQMHLMKIRGLIYTMTAGQRCAEVPGLLDQVRGMETSMNRMGDRVSRETALARVRVRRRLEKLQRKMAKAGRKLTKTQCKDPALYRKRRDDDDGDQDGHQGGGGTSTSIGIRATGVV